MKKNEYPIHRKDSFGRIVFSKWNENEKSIKKYYENSNELKILYKFYGENLIIEAFDKNKNNIISYKNGKISINIPDYISIDEENNINFKIKKEFIRKMMKILRE